MKRAFTWFWLLNKRLYKKPTFIILLALIPALVLAFGVAARDDSGLIRIALAQTEQDDRLSREIIDDLLGESRLIQFTDYFSPEEAVSAVRSGSMDAAWIFPADTQQKIDKFISTKSENDYIVRVIEREQTIPLRLSLEKLCGALYKHCSRSMYISYTRNNVSELDTLSDNELLEFYNAFEMNGELFTFAYPDSSESTHIAENTGYLLTPVRGLLSVLVLLCGLAATMFFLQDEKSGTFAWLSEEKRPLAAFACQLIAVLNIAAVMLISLMLIGLASTPVREIITLILYTLCCAGFCSLMLLLFRDIKLLGAAIPVLIVVMTAICPVFFDFKSIRWIQMLFPPTYYINAAHNLKFVWYMVIYFVSSATLCCAIRKLTTKGVI